MGLVFRPTSVAAASMRPYALKLASSLPGQRGVKHQVIDGFLLRAVGDGRKVTVYVIEPPPMLGAVFPFYYRPVHGWPVIWTSTAPGAPWAPHKPVDPQAPVEALTVGKPSNSAQLGPYVAGTLLSVGGAQPAGLASSVFAGAFLRISTGYSVIAATRCTASMNAADTFTGQNANQPMLPASFSYPPSPAKLSLASIAWPFMAGFGQSGYASGIEWGAKAGLLVGHAFNNDTYYDLNHAAAFWYALTRSEDSAPYTLSVPFTRDWKDTTLQGVVWAKNAGFEVTAEDLQADPAAADAIFIIEKRSNYRTVTTSYFRHSIPVECPQTPEGEWGTGSYCSAQAGQKKGNHWPAGNMYTQVQLERTTAPAFDYETCIVTAHPDGTTSEAVLSRRTTDQTDLARENDTLYAAVFGVNTRDGEPRLLCRKTQYALRKTPGTPAVITTFVPDMNQNFCTDNASPPPDDGATGTRTVSSGIQVQTINRLATANNVERLDVYGSALLDVTSWVLVAPSGSQTALNVGDAAPMSFAQGSSGVTYCAYAPGLFAMAAFARAEVEGEQRSLRIQVFSADTGALIASSPVLLTLAGGDLVSITCAKVGTLDPEAPGEAIKEHATLLLTVTPSGYRVPPYEPQAVPLYALNDLATLATVATAPAGTPVFELGTALSAARKGAVPRVRPVTLNP